MGEWRSPVTAFISRLIKLIYNNPTLPRMSVTCLRRRSRGATRVLKAGPVAWYHGAAGDSTPETHRPSAANTVYPLKDIFRLYYRIYFSFNTFQGLTNVVSINEVIQSVHFPISVGRVSRFLSISIYCYVFDLNELKSILHIQWISIQMSSSLDFFHPEIKYFRKIVQLLTRPAYSWNDSCRK